MKLESDTQEETGYQSRSNQVVFRRVSAEELEGSITMLDRLALQLCCVVNTSATVTNSPLDVAAILPITDTYGAN